MRPLRVLFLIATFQSSIALAYRIEYFATLAQPVAEEKVYVVDQNLWRCKADKCSLISNPVDAASIRSCNALSRQVGSVSSYGKSGHMLSADDLAKCNAGAKR